MKKSATIYLMHHSLTPGDDTPEELSLGWKDQPLSKEGRQILSPTIDYLKDKNIGETYSSDLGRAVESAKIVHDGLGIEKPNTERRGLRPMNVGIYAGLKKSDVIEALSDLKSRRWAAAPGGESYGRFLGRFGQELHRTIQEALGEEYNCLYVMHSHNFGAIPHLLSGGKKPTEFKGDVREGGIAILNVKNGGGTISYDPGAFDPRA